VSARFRDGVDCRGREKNEHSLGNCDSGNCLGGAVIEATVARVKLRQTKKFSKNLEKKRKVFF
jgi:hypothetical protein